MAGLENQSEKTDLNQTDLDKIGANEFAFSNETMDMLEKSGERDKQGKEAKQQIDKAGRLSTKLEETIKECRDYGVDCSYLEECFKKVQSHLTLMQDSFDSLVSKRILDKNDGHLLTIAPLSLASVNDFNNLNQKVDNYKTFVKDYRIENSIVDRTKKVEQKKNDEEVAKERQGKEDAERKQKDAEGKLQESEKNLKKEKGRNNQLEQETENLRKQKAELEGRIAQLEDQNDKLNRKEEIPVEQQGQISPEQGTGEIVNNEEGQQAVERVEETVSGLIEELKGLLNKDLEYKGQVNVNGEYFINNKISYREDGYLTTIHVEGKNYSDGEKLNYDLNYSIDADGYPVLFKNNKKGEDERIDSRYQVARLKSVKTRVEAVIQAIKASKQQEAWAATGQINQRY